MLYAICGLIMSGRAPHGARGLKFALLWPRRFRTGRRAPHGARGLKCHFCEQGKVKPPSRPARGARIEILSTRTALTFAMSRPARGARIEIQSDPCSVSVYKGRAPHGARGLKFSLTFKFIRGDCRAPHGARGLKSVVLMVLVFNLWSRPARGARIEIYARRGSHYVRGRRAPHGARGLKCNRRCRRFMPYRVAPRTGRED